MAKRTMTEADLMELKKKIEAGKTKISELKGKQDYLMKELADSWGVKSVEDANKLVASLQKKLDDVSNKLDEILDEIAENYTDDEE